MATNQKEYMIAYRLRKKEEIKVYGATRYQKNKEHILELNKKWRLENSEKKSELSRKWQENNKPRRAANEAKRRSAKSNATPSWLSSEDLEKILKIYEEASLLQYHVDHIVPLRGKKVCGLHVPWNLQILPPKENLIKHNRFDEAQGDILSQSLV